MTDEISQLNNLKVVDLKNRLKNLGLSTAGLKQQLVDRLAEALQPKAGDVEQTEEETGEVQQDELENENENENKKTDDRAVETETPTLSARENQDEQEPEIAANGTEDPSATDAEKNDPNDDTKLSKSGSNGEESLSALANGEQAEDTGIPETTSTDAEQLNSFKRASSPTLDDTSAPAPKKARSHGAAIHPATNTLYVSNLSRPLVSSAFQEYVEGVAEESASYFWMDKLKTHCFVTFSSTEVATRARTAIHRSRYPSGELSRKQLFADFIPEETAHKFAEEADDSKGPWRKMKVLYTVNDTGVELTLVPHSTKVNKPNANGHSQTKALPSGPSNSSVAKPRSDSRRGLPILWTRTNPSIKFREAR
ncbi:hypothetical protein AWJ20_3009 [Sugiyamaella lignohabitans]|uniref:SAP domain-containing protein n=1 Tax=Sugiyamaella lignohabitans TaxID=796027 RepID=A0A167FJJ1_9ASCO|nr:uncharacterized protein AWJ20_3009 [Sugiyamaella lignohabitans]ANB15382.1 hypothetical protein AWJ20_3009 [Sugiyamaella lignohabitans]